MVKNDNEKQLINGLYKYPYEMFGNLFDSFNCSTIIIKI